MTLENRIISIKGEVQISSAVKPQSPRLCTLAKSLYRQVEKKIPMGTFQFSVDKCQVPTKTALSLPLLSWTGERKYDERLESQDKDMERSLTNYCYGQNRLNLGRKGSFIYHQSNQRRIVRNKTRS